MEVTREHARRVLDVVDKGLSHGMGNPVPGEMCVEALIKCGSQGAQWLDLCGEES